MDYWFILSSFLCPGNLNYSLNHWLSSPPCISSTLSTPLLSQMWTFIVLLLSRKAFRIPHRFVLCHLVCVLLSCIGVVIGSFLRHLERRKFALQPDLTDRKCIKSDEEPNSPANFSLCYFALFILTCRHESSPTSQWLFSLCLHIILLSRDPSIGLGGTEAKTQN